MKISIIVAMSRNRVIGKGDAMPWHLPAELRHFKQVTMGKPIIMGRKTFESIGRVLPGRRNIIITRDPQYEFEDAIIVHSIDEALKAAGNTAEVMIVGGGHLYRQMIKDAECLYLTIVETDIEGDVFFPLIAEKEWRTTQELRRAPDEKNQFAMRFMILERNPVRRTENPNSTACCSS